MPNTGNTQQVINYGASPNDGLGDPLRTAFIKTDENFDNIWLAGPVGSNITIGNNSIQVNNTNGNLILQPNGVGIIQANANFVPSANNIRDLGSSSSKWRRAYIQNLSIANLEVPGDAVISGNLTVEGDTIQIGNIVTDTLTIQLANTAANSAQANGAGITVGASDDLATLLYNSTSNVWTTNIGLGITGAVTASGNITGNYILGNGAFLTGLPEQYGNANVANYLPTYSGYLSGSRLDISGSGNIWTINNDRIISPTGATWISDIANNDEFIASSPDGYIDMQSLYANANVASGLHLEHGLAHISVNNGSEQRWVFDVSGSFTVPGKILPNISDLYDLGAAGNQWNNLYVGTTYANRLEVTNTGNTWTITNDRIISPDGGVWLSDTTFNDEYLQSRPDGYINLQSLYANANVASELHLEHSLAHIIVNDGIPQKWTFDVSGEMTVPGSIIPLANGIYSLGNSTNYWSNLWVANNTIYIGGVPLGVTTGNVLTVGGEPVLTNDSNTSITTTGNITADYFLGDGSQLTGMYGNTNVAAYLPAYTGNLGAGNVNFNNGSRIQTVSNNINLQANVNGAVEIKSDGGDYTWAFDNYGWATLPESDAAYTPVANGSVLFAPTALTFKAGLANLTFDYIGDLSVPGNITTTGNVTAGYFIGDGSQLTGLPASYGNANVADFLANFGSNTISTTGNITAGNISGNISITGNVTGTSANVTLIADSYSWTFDNAGNLVLPGNTFAVNYANGTAVQLGGAGTYGNSNVATFLAAFGSNSISTTGNVTADNFIGNIELTGNIQGTSANVELVAGSYTFTFDNVGVATFPAVGGDEGGEINFGIPTANTTLTGPVKFDVYQDRIRFFDGSAKGVYIDMAQAGAGVSTLLNNRVSGFVNAGTFVTMDNIKATVTSSAPRGLSLATVSGSFSYNIGGNFALAGGPGGSVLAGQTLTTTPTTSIFGWGFTVSGDLSTYVLTDTTNNRCYRITLQIGASFNNNSIVIERLI